MLSVCEGVSEVVITKTQKKLPNGFAEVEDEDETEDEDATEDEDEEQRSREIKVHKVIAEAALKGVKRGNKIEVTINVESDLRLNIASRIVGTQIGVRGEVTPRESG